MRKGEAGVEGGATPSAEAPSATRIELNVGGSSLVYVSTSTSGTQGGSFTSETIDGSTVATDGRWTQVLIFMLSFINVFETIHRTTRLTFDRTRLILDLDCSRSTCCLLLISLIRTIPL